MSLEPALKAFLYFWRTGGVLNKQTYRIIGSTLAIPGVPGEWHAGQEVDVNTDTNEVLDVRLLPTTPEDADPEQATDEQTPTQPQEETLEYPPIASYAAMEGITQSEVQ